MKKWYLVTGGTSGIGFETSKLLFERNCNVVIVGSRSESVEDALNKLPQDCVGLTYDFRDLSHLESIFIECSNRGIILDGLVHCAGVSPLILLKDNSIEEMERVYRINTFSFVELSRLFYQEKYGKAEGAIVTVASNAAHAAGYRQVLYGGSKAAMIASVKLMAKELLNRKIRVNCVSPGACETRLLQDLRSKSDQLDEKIIVGQPLGIIPPQEVASLIYYLLSSEAGHITGQEFFCDGGSMLK